MGGSPLAQSLWLKAKEIVRANGEPPIVTSLAQRASYAREASVGITSPGSGLFGFKAPHTPRDRSAAHTPEINVRPFHGSGAK